MTATFCVDTNVLLYAASNAPEDQTKRTVARQVLSRPGIGFSAQVLQEFYAAAVAKQRLQITHDEAVAALESLATFPVCPVTRELVLEAVGVKQQFGLSYWDAAIIAAAKRLGCQTIFTEDLNDGQNDAGVRAVNPFRAVPQPTSSP